MIFTVLVDSLKKFFGHWLSQNIIGEFVADGLEKIFVNAKEAVIAKKTSEEAKNAVRRITEDEFGQKIVSPILEELSPKGSKPSEVLQIFLETNSKRRKEHYGSSNAYQGLSDDEKAIFDELMEQARTEWIEQIKKDSSLKERIERLKQAEDNRAVLADDMQEIKDLLWLIIKVLPSISDEKAEKNFSHVDEKDASEEKLYFIRNEGVEASYADNEVKHPNGSQFSGNCNAEEDLPYEINNGVLISCRADCVGEIRIKDGITEISENAFSGCQMSSVTIPDSVKIIRRKAFENCPNLIAVHFLGRDIILEDDIFWANSRERITLVCNSPKVKRKLRAKFPQREQLSHGCEVVYAPEFIKQRKDKKKRIKRTIGSICKTIGIIFVCLVVAVLVVDTTGVLYGTKDLSIYCKGSKTMQAGVMRYNHYVQLDYTEIRGYVPLGIFDSDGEMLFDASGKSIAKVRTRNLCDYDDITLEVSYAPIEYSIEYEDNKGANNTNPTTYTVESEITLKNLQKQGYVFLGWKNEQGRTCTSISHATGNVKLTAQWQPATYSVRYDANGGTGATATSVHTYDAEKALASNKFTRTGYTFIGWNTKVDGSGIAYANGETVMNLTSEQGKTLTLYAQWAVAYTIVYDANGGTGTMPTSGHVFDRAKALTPNKFTRKGYTFIGWNTMANGKGTAYVNGETVTNLTQKPNGTVTLYAQWQPNSYTVTFDAKNGVCSEASRKVTYDSTYGNLPTPTYSLSDYVITFVGWYTAKGVKVDENTVMQTAENTTLTARWSMLKVKSTIVFSAGNGERDKKITDSDKQTEVVYPNLDREKLKSNGYTKLKVSITFDCKEIDDGYQEIWVYSHESNQVHHEEFEHGSGHKDTSWWSHTTTFNISLNDVQTDGSFWIRWGANGAFSDDWWLGYTVITVEAIQ